MGTIYEAVQESLGRPVAIKTMRDDRAHGSSAYEARFLREQAVLARLHHTNIVSIHAAGRDGSRRYFAMPYVRGAAVHHLVRSVWDYGSSHPKDETPSLAEFASSAEEDKRSAGVVSGAMQESTAAPPAASADPAPKALSTKYLRSVAKVLVDAADAIQHAHDAGICHRDVKPSNLMVDASERCWVLDFGLASYHARQNGHSPRVPNLDLPSEPEIIHSGVLGTPEYMAPEQYDGRADARSDVWGLGVTLYEMISLRRPFSGKSRKALEAAIRADEPIPLKHLVTKLCPDLAAICRKAMHKSPSERYQTAAEFRDDLRNWLAYKPVSARPARALRSSLLWSRRHPWGAGAIGFIACLLVCLGVGGVALARMAREREQAKDRAIQLHELQGSRLGRHEYGWSRDRSARLSQLADANRSDPTFISALRDEAVAGLIGFDVSTRPFHGFGADSLSFDHKRRLLMGGVKDAKEHSLLLPTRIWEDDPLSEPRLFKLAAKGRVGFRGEVPIQLEPRESSVVLHDLERDAVLLEIPQPGRPDEQLVMLDDASVIATLVDRPDDGPNGTGPRLLIVWDGCNGKELRRFPGDHRAAALSPDGRFVAAGDGDGRITLWVIETGEKVAYLSLKGHPIVALSFGSNPHLDHRPDANLPAARRWQISAGDIGGAVGTWDLAAESPFLRCLFSVPGVQLQGLTFSPDGSLLVTAEQGCAGLWDVARGERLLDMMGVTTTPAIAFDPSGTRIAISWFDTFTPGASVSIHELRNGRGVRSLIGLGTVAREIVLSPDDRLVAALGNDWQIAIWERASGRLLALLDAPPGIHVDNAGLAISPDNRRVAFSSHERARMWDIETGTILRDWALPTGLNDKLIFRGVDHLDLARAEAKDGKPPYGLSEAERERFPTFCAIYDLLGDQAVKPIPSRIISDLSISNAHVWISPDGRHLLLDGLSGEIRNGKTMKSRHTARLYTFPAGVLRNVDPVDIGINTGIEHLFDPEGSLLALHHKTVSSPGGAYLYEYLPIPSGESSEAPENLFCLGSRGQRWAARVDRLRRIGYFINGRPNALFTVDTNSALQPRHFTRDGRFAIGGRHLSSVTVLDFHEIDEQLRAIGLGW